MVLIAVCFVVDNTLLVGTKEEVEWFKNPGMQGECTYKWAGDAVDPEMYQNIVGKIMYLACKLFAEGLNAAREIA
jgi:hypothetical protein